MSEFKLNDEQRKLVEDNHGLIFTFMGVNRLSTNETTDWYGILACALCKAAYIYDSSLGKFSTIAFLCMGSAYRNEIKTSNRRIKTVSLDDKFCKSEDGEDIINFIEDSTNYFSDIEFRELIARGTRKMSERDKDIFLRIIAGELEKDIAEEYNISKQRVSKIYISCKESFLNNINGAYIF